jgi:SEC-C motif-containing protein
MRSRYSAFALGEAAYLARTTVRTTLPVELAELEKWCKSVAWLGLSVVDRAGGGVEDESGEVEFEARYMERGRMVSLKERSRFLRRDGAWLYENGPTQVQETAVERNQPCPCGSGRKFKACHA